MDGWVHSEDLVKQGMQSSQILAINSILFIGLEKENCARVAVPGAHGLADTGFV